MLSKLRTGLRALLRKSEIERELDEELRYHVEQQTEQNIRLGMNSEEARYAARKAFGGVEQAKEQSRDARGVRWIEELWQDLRYGARTLLKKPGFTLIAAITLALGIGMNTAIFSVVQAVLMRPLPFANSNQLVRLFETFPQDGNSEGFVSVPNFKDWREQNQGFEHLTAIRPSAFDLTGGDLPERISGVRVSSNFFSLLDVKPILGRTLLPEEEQPGRENIVLISHSLWQRRFGSDPNIIGRTVTIGEQSFSVVGVMPPDFQFPPRIEIWAPIAFTPRELAPGRRSLHNLPIVIARLKPGVTLERAQSEMDSIARRLEQQSPGTETGHGIRLIPLHQQMVGGVSMALYVLLAAVGFVLLIACTNVANLLLARAAARQKEMAIRTALGAARWRIIKQLLTESVLLALVGGALGVLLAVWGTDLLIAVTPSNLPRRSEISVDASVFGFAFLVSLLTGVIFGLAPALQASKVDLVPSLKEGSQSSLLGHGHHRALNLFVVAEVAMALVLLVGAGLAIRSFLRLGQVNPGFDPQNVLTAHISLPSTKYRGHQTAFYRQVLERVKSLPGVETASVNTPLPFTGGSNSTAVMIDGRSKPDADLSLVSPEYFTAMKITLMKGRRFTELDQPGAPPVMIINEAMARRHFPGEDPIGKRIKIGYGDDPSPRLVVGVVGDVKHSILDIEPRDQIYVPFDQEPTFSFRLVVRTTVEPLSLVSAVHRAVLAVDKERPLAAVGTMEQLISDSIAGPRFRTRLLGLFATIALILTVVGIYGVMSYAVAQRTHEIGVRMALGAQVGDVLKLVIRQGMTLALIGVAIGLMGAFALTHMIKTLLFGVSATDPLTYIVIALLLIVVALLASYVPARRATKVDPMTALRCE